jgi:hypothetical protein
MSECREVQLLVSSGRKKSLLRLHRKPVYAGLTQHSELYMVSAAAPSRRLELRHFSATRRSAVNTHQRRARQKTAMRKLTPPVDGW